MNGLPAAVLPVDVNDSPAADRLGALFDAHQSRLYRLARRLVSNSDEARDLVQETFLRAAKSPAAVPVGAIAEEAWLVRVLINICRDEWRKAAVRRAAALGRPAAAPTNPEPSLIAGHAVWQALQSLHPRRRAVVVMHELEEMQASEVASLLGISKVTVRWHLSRGRRELARVLNPSIRLS
jgi:RNA polymerase sigma factor (sigma-70 family)